MTGMRAHTHLCGPEVPYVGQIRTEDMDKDGYRSFRLLQRKTTGKKAVASTSGSLVLFTTSCFPSVSGQ